MLALQKIMNHKTIVLMKTHIVFTDLVISYSYKAYSGRNSYKEFIENYLQFFL